MEERNPITINKPHLLAVEGKDECNFFKVLLKTININNVQLVDVGGRKNFSNTFEGLVSTEGFKRVNRIGFIRDAEDKIPNDAHRSICGTLSKFSLPVPKYPEKIISTLERRIGIYIMPDNLNTGMLEDLCLKSIEQEPVSSCINNYINCLAQNKIFQENDKFEEAKSRVQIYLASRSPLADILGLGTQKGYWNFDHPCFDEIKTFLKAMFDS